MKLNAEIGNNKHEVEIKREDGKLFATIDDRIYELDTSEPESNIYLFKYEGRVIEASVSAPNTSDGITKVRVGTNEFDVKLIDPKRLRGAGSGNEHADGVAEIKTAMPGKVVRVIVSVGTKVEAGDGVLVVEAMKMQNELKSPKAGTVREIRVEEGAAVAAGDILATVE
jgi:biotin carboxyl carrier protein